MIFPVIDFRYNIDLSNFFAGGKSNYMVYLETKNDIIQFSMKVRNKTVFQYSF